MGQARALLVEPPLWPAYKCWRGAAGALADFVPPTPFLSPYAPPARRPSHPAAGAVVEVIGRCAAAPGARTAFFLETPPRLGLAVATSLLRRGWSVAPLYGRWPDEPGRRSVLPTGPLLAWLAWIAQRMDAETKDARLAAPAGPLCLLLDAERHLMVSRWALCQRFDNRYDYAAHMLPPAERLLEVGVRRLRWLAPAATVPDDLEPYATGLAAAGIELDLAALPRTPVLGRTRLSAINHPPSSLRRPSSAISRLSL